MFLTCLDNKAHISSPTVKSSPIRTSVENSPFAEDDSNNRSFVLIHAADSRQYKFSKKCYLIRFRSIFKPLILSRNQFNFLHQKLNQKHITCRRVFIEKVIAFLSCTSIPVIRNFRKKNHFEYKFSRYSNSYINKTTGSISSIRVGVKNILAVKNLSIGALLIYAPCISFLEVRDFQEVLLFFNSLIFQSFFLSYYKFEFFHHEVSLKSNTGRGVLK